MNSSVDIKSLTSAELKEFLTENGFKAFRAKQVEDWLKKGVTTFDEMKNIPSDLKEFLKTRCYISVAYIEKKLKSRYDKTVKYLFALSGGEYVESVVMSYKHGWSMCISTHGMYLLRNRQKRFFARLNSLGNARPDRSRSARFGYSNFKCGADGYGRTAR